MRMGLRRLQHLDKPDAWPGRTVPDGPTAVRLFLPRLEVTRNVQIFVDLGASAGGGVVDSLKFTNLSLRVRPVSFGTRSQYRDKTGLMQMLNLRAEMYWRLREALDPVNGGRLVLPNDPELLSELCSVRWESDNFKVRVEDKDDIKRRLKRSPDKADAVAMLMLGGGSSDGGWVPGDDRWAPDTDDDEDDDRGANPYKPTRGFMGVW